MSSLLSGVTVYQHLFNLLEIMSASQPTVSMAELTRDLHIWPDFHGNRSPLADSSLKGMVYLTDPTDQLT